MGTSYDKFLKKFNKGFQERKTNRVVKRTKPYGRGLGKSHKQYIAGDIVSSASNRAYGYKMNGITPINQFTGGQDPYLYKQQQEGKNPYEFKYVYTGKPTWVKGGTNADGKKYKGFWSKNRLATDKEKDLYKKTGDLDFERADRKLNYSVMRGHNEKAEKFKEHLNTPVWDGLEVAKNRVKNGDSKFEYLKGFLKDVAVDPLFDTLKTFDKYESALTGSIGGAIEESRNVFDAFADKDISKIDFKRPIKNAQESFSESDKTGWGKSMGDFFSEAVDRRDERELARLKSLPQDAYTKLQIKNIKEKQNNKINKAFETIVGFAGDIASPVNLGTGVLKTGKKLSGNAINSFNDLRKGTADLSMGIVPKHVREANQKKAMEIARKSFDDVSKGSSEVLDVLHETKPMNDLKIYDDYKLDGALNQGYKSAINNDVDKIIKTNPATQNLGNFLDNLKPQKSQVIDDFENMFEASDVPNSKLGKDIFFKKIDNLPDRESDEVLDWLAEYNPKVYDEYIGASEDVSNVLNDAIQINDKVDKSAIHNVSRTTKNASQKPKYDYKKIDEMIEENAVEEIAKLFDGTTPKRQALNSYHRKDMFEKSIRSLSDDIYNGKIDGDDLSKTIKNVKGRDVPIKIKRDYINNKLFNGEKVIASNVGNQAIDEFIDSIDDVVNLRRVVDNYMATGEILPVKLSDSTKSFLKLTDDVKVKGSKIQGIVNNDPEELLETLNKSIINRARALTDNRYRDKLQLMASKFGYKNYTEEITDNITKLKSELKKLDKLPYSEETVAKKLEISNNLKRLNEVKNNRTDMWNKIKNFTEYDFDKFVSNEYPEFMKDMSSYSLKSNQAKEIQKLSNLDGYNEIVRKTKADYYNRKAKVDRDDIIADSQKINKGDEVVYSTRDKKADIEKIRKAEDVEEKKYASTVLSNVRKELNLKYVDFKKINIPKNAKQTYPSLVKTKGVKDALENIKKLVLKETKLRAEGYSKDASIVREEMMYFVRKLDEANVDRKAWFGEMKKIKDKFNVKPATKEDIFEKTGLVINKKVGTVGSKQNPLFMEELNMENQFKDKFFVDEFERILESIAPKDLLNANHKPRYIGDIAQHGDNIADNTPKTSLNDLSKKSTSKKNDSTKYVNGFDEFNQKSNLNIKDDYVNPEVSLTEELANEDEIYDIINKIGKKYGGEDIKPPSFEEFKGEFKDNHMKYEDSKIYDIYKRWLNTWKKGLTVYNPGWHAQNFLQNKGQNYLALGKDAFGSQKNAKNLLNYLQGGENKVKDVIDKKNGVVYSGDELKTLVKRLKVVNSQTNDIIESRGMIPKLETKIDNSNLMKKLGHSEDTARLYHFISQLERGMSPEDATKSVNKYLFDYDKKSKFDKVVGDFVDPFWTFHKNYAKLLGKTAVENPSAINNILRSERGLESGLAEGERNDTSTQWDKIQSPYSSFKDEKNGKMYDYLYKQNMMPRIQDAIPTNQDEVENKLNPILRLLLQQSRNEGNFHNKIVDKDKAGWNEVTEKDRAKEIASELNPFLNSLVKAGVNSSKHQKSADDGKQSQDTSNKQILLDWVQFITGNKGNYYKR